MRKLGLALSAAVLAVSVVGCARPAPGTTAPQAASTASREAAPASTPADLGPMDNELKLSQIAANFPLEVPVIEGTVLRGEAQGEDAWDYELAVNADAASTAAWYESAFGSKNWQVARRREVAGDGASGVELTMFKGAAETRVVAMPDGEGSRVSVVLGVGAPVLQTQ